MDEKILLKIEDESKNFPNFSYVGETLPTVRWKPLFGETKQYDLFFTDSRIIAAVVFTSDVLPPILMDYDGVKSMNKTIREWKKTRDEMRRKFKNSAPDEILHMDPESFEIRYENVEEIRIQKGIRKIKLIIKMKIDGEIDEKKFPIPKSRLEELETFIQVYVKLSDKFIKTKEG